MEGIILLGLGPGDPGLITRQAWDILEKAGEVHLRTKQHPAVEGLPTRLIVHSFDDIYEAEEDFNSVYARIIDEVIQLGRRPEGVLYAVPGHPLIGETTGPEILRRAQAEGIPVQVVEGISFITPSLAAVGADPLPQTAIVDALELVSAHYPPFPPSSPALIAQVFSPRVAGELKITLTALYPDEHRVKMVHAAGTGAALVEEMYLHEIDQSAHIGLLTSLYLPPLGEYTSFEEFQELIAHLRAPEGCPWDQEQTHQSLRRNLLEEAYEALAAIDADDPASMLEEFGDLLLQIVLQAQIASEYGEFHMSDVIHAIHTKLVRRHPHVFGDVDLENSGEVIANWERLKENERREKGEKKENGLLDGIPLDMPALVVAEAYQRRAARIGFDWPEIEGVLDKILEEITEYRSAESMEDKREEFGDLLFALVNLARWVDLDPETALRETNAKFKTRFAEIEAAALKMGKQISDMSLAEMDEIWEKAKKKS
ncbi:MAG: nucleoside triphosphate pyrophosphohydrolase [Anaerolineae bacterium]|nr:nucleoside triphosphate pyrophosphohydrolase [Anaerolineae bacterium]